MMGFDVFGPTRYVQASHLDDDGTGPHYDILALPGAYEHHCPQIDRLHGRTYEDTTVRVANGEVSALRDELIQLEQAYRTRREPELIKERKVRASDPEIRREIVERILQDDILYRALRDFRLLCEEAVAMDADVRCRGD